MNEAELFETIKIIIILIIQVMKKICPNVYLSVRAMYYDEMLQPLVAPWHQQCLHNGAKYFLKSPIYFCQFCHGNPHESLK